MLICCFKGLGKSTLVKSIPNFVELNFDDYNDMENYISNALIFHNKNYNVLLDSNIEIRENLFDKNLPFVTILPKKERKDEFLSCKYFSKKDKKYLKDNWENLLKKLKDEIIIELDAEDYLFDALQILTNLRREFKMKMKEMDSTGISNFAPEKCLGVINLSGNNNCEDLENIGIDKLDENLLITIDDLCDD